MIKTNIIELRNLIVNSNSEEEICSNIHKLNHLLLNSKLTISFKNVEFTLYPLWVEIYYYNNKRWPDEAVHGEGKFIEQINNEFTLYFHRPPNRNSSYNGGRPGVDLVLSNSKNYAFSVLIKNCIFEMNNKKINLSESELDGKICSLFKNENLRLSGSQNIESRTAILNVKIFDNYLNKKLCIFDTKRVGLETSKIKKWADYEFASFIMRKDFYKDTEGYKNNIATKLTKYY